MIHEEQQKKKGQAQRQRLGTVIPHFHFDQNKRYEMRRERVERMV
jgi:hypothetical protein